MSAPNELVTYKTLKLFNSPKKIAIVGSLLTKKLFCFRLKDQEQNPKIKEGELIGIPIQSCHDLIWGNCGYLLVSNDKEAIQNLEKAREEPHYFQLETEIRAEGQFMEDVTSDEGKNLEQIGKEKWYVEDPNWGEKIKLVYYGEFKYFVPKNIIENQNNLLKISIEQKQYYFSGLIDTLTFKGEKINQYRDLLAKNCGKKFKIVGKEITFNDRLFKDEDWDSIKLSDEKANNKPEKTILEIKKSLKKYYQENDIKMIKLSDEDKEFMDIVFNSGEKKSSNNFSNQHDKQKLEQVKIYLKSNNKEILSYSELITSSGINPSHNSNEGNSGISGGKIALIIVGVISVVSFFSWLIWKGKRTDAAPTTHRIRRGQKKNIWTKTIKKLR